MVYLIHRKHYIFNVTYDRTIRYLVSCDLQDMSYMSLSHYLSLTYHLFLCMFPISHFFSVVLHTLALLIFRCIFVHIWDDDLCHYFLIHECTRGRVRVSYVSLTCVYSFTYEWEWSKGFKEHACKQVEISFQILKIQRS